MWRVVDVLSTIYSLISALLTLIIVATGCWSVIGLLGRRLYLRFSGLIHGERPASD